MKSREKRTHSCTRTTLESDATYTNLRPLWHFWFHKMKFRLITIVSTLLFWFRRNLGTSLRLTRNGMQEIMEKRRNCCIHSFFKLKTLSIETVNNNNWYKMFGKYA